MKKGFKGIVILLLVVVIVVFTVLIFNLKTKFAKQATENANRIDAYIENMVDESLKLVSAEGKYEEIITAKQTWILGLNPSTAWVKANGVIKVGSRLIDVSKEEGKYIFKLSEPEILEHTLTPEGQWSTNEGLFNSFDSARDGEILAEQKRKIEAERFEELSKSCKLSNDQIVKSFLSSLGKEISYDIKYVSQE